MSEEIPLDRAVIIMKYERKLERAKLSLRTLEHALENGNVSGRYELEANLPILRGEVLELEDIVKALRQPILVMPTAAQRYTIITAPQFEVVHENWFMNGTTQITIKRKAKPHGTE